MREFMMVGMGAFFGANVRYWVANVFAARFGPAFPYGTLFINISGSFVLGFVLTLIGNRLIDDPGYRLLIGTGFLGAYTTFSTFSFDTITLLEQNDLVAAITNAGSNLLGCLLAVWLGVIAARYLG